MPFVVASNEANSISFNPNEYPSQILTRLQNPKSDGGKELTGSERGELRKLEQHYERYNRLTFLEPRITRREEEALKQIRGLLNSTPEPLRLSEGLSLTGGLGLFLTGYQGWAATHASYPGNSNPVAGLVVLSATILSILGIAIYEALSGPRAEGVKDKAEYYPPPGERSFTLK